MFQTWCYLIWSILGCTNQQSILYFVTLHLYQIPWLMHWKFSELFAMRQNPLTPSPPRHWVKPKFLNSETYYQSYNGCLNQRHGIVGWSGLLIAADCSKTSKFTDSGGTFNLYTRKSRGWIQRSYKQWKLLKEDSKCKTYFWLQLKNKQWLVGTDIRYQSGCSPWASDL